MLRDEWASGSRPKLVTVLVLNRREFITFVETPTQVARSTLEIPVTRTIQTGLLLGLAAAVLLGQPLPTALPAQPLGPDDLIALTVANLPELTHVFRIGPDGLLRLPSVAKPVEARGKYPFELEQTIRETLKRDRILVDPVVSLSVVEYAARPVTVMGAVRRPTTFQATPQTTVLEALARAEGLAPEAGPTILVTRKGPGGSSETLTLSVKALIERADPVVNFRLFGGEQIRVPDAPRVYVLGRVKRPTFVPVKDPAEATVLKILAQVEGLADFASSELVIYRPLEDGAKEIVVDLKKILKGESPDLKLQAYDVLYVPESKGRRLRAEIVSALVGFGTSTASGILVFNR